MCHRSLLPILLSLFSFTLSGQVADTLNAFLCYEEGGELLEAGKLKEAAEVFSIAIEEYRKNGPDEIRLVQMYRTMGYCLENMGHRKQALETYYSALSILKEGGYSGDILGEVYYALGRVCLYECGDEVISYSQKAVEQFGPSSLGAAKAYTQMGFLYSYQDKLDLTAEYYEKALAIQKEQLSGADPALAQSYHKLGMLYQRTWDLERSEQYLQEGLSIMLENYSEDHFEVGPFLNSLAITYKWKKEYPKAIDLFKLAIDGQTRNHGPNLFSLGTIHNNLGTCYYEMLQYKDALEQFTEAKRIYQMSGYLREHSAGVLLGHIAHCLFHLGQEDEALEMYRQAEALFLPELKDGYSASVATTRTSIGRCYRVLGRPREAIRYLEQALQAVSYDPDGPPRRWVSFGNVFYPLVEYASALLDLYEQSRDLQDLYRAAEIIESAYMHSVQAYGELFDDLSRQIFFDRFFSLYEKGILTHYRLYEATGESRYLERSFQLAEISKNVLLQMAFNQARAGAVAGVPESILQREEALQTQLLEASRNLHEVQEKGGDSLAMAGWDSLYFATYQAQELLADSIRSQYPDYFKLKYDRAAISLLEVKKEMLKAEEALVEYFVGDQRIFVFVVRSDTAYVVPIELDPDFHRIIGRLRFGVIAPFSPEYGKAPVPPDRGNRLYAENALQLYQLLIAPLGDLPEKLIIVPDGLLGYVPFELLLTGPPDDLSKPQHYPYLIRSHQISYSYSATLKQEMQDRKATGRGALGVAPFFPDCLGKPERGSSEFCQLKYAQEEVAYLEKRFGARALTGLAVHSATFKGKAPLYGVLHLATHALAEDRAGRFSHLLFSLEKQGDEPDRLYVQDLYALKLPAQMVFLGACETGIGELKRGEGIISLARGFSYAGAKSIITSLWKVDDKLSFEITRSFYENLAAGMTKDAALRKAKLTYLDGHVSIEAHPFYWAPYIAIGDMSPVELGSPGPSYWSWLAGAAALAGFWFLWRKRREGSVKREAA